ncbi:lipopolysaccharide biosynthesis protein [Streptomyces sp. NPDC004129]|uniref:lipopolysaccharide biosynthesis protein n=1 Tax=Streptomyces sp. NPDC004533 TaxID=3154278 RepID=UPI0033B079FF
MTRKEKETEAALTPRLLAALHGEAALAVLGVAGGAVTALAGSLVVARYLEPTERGHYASIVVFATLALTCLEMGGEVGVVRGLADVRRAGRSFPAGYLAWTVLASASVAVVGSAAGTWAPTWMRPVWLLPPCATAAVYGGLVFRLTTGTLVSSGRLGRLIAVRTLGNCGPVLGCLLCARLGLTSALEVATLSFAAQAVMNSVLLLRLGQAGEPLLGTVRRAGGGGWHRNIALVWCRGNVHLHVLNGSTYVLQRSDQMALTLLGADRTLGLYAIAINVSEIVSYVPAALFPLVSRGRPGNPVELRRILLLLAVCVGTCTPLAYVALPLVYGEAYRAAQPAVLLLVPATGVLAVGRLFQGVELRDTRRRGNLAVIAVTAAVVEFTSVYLFGGAEPVTAAFACASGYAVFTVWITLSRGTRSPLGPRPLLETVPAPGNAPESRTADGLRD